MPIVKGFLMDSKTGELKEYSCRFAGHYPYVDPDTCVFLQGPIIEGAPPPPPASNHKEIAFRKRDRSRRDQRIVDSQEVIDPRPVAGAVAFAPQAQPEDMLRKMVEDAWNRQDQRLLQTLQSGQSFYPTDFDDNGDNAYFDESDDQILDRVSAYELVPDKVGDAEVMVPRALKGRFKLKPKASGKDSSVSATPPAPSPSPAPAGSQQPEGAGAAKPGA